MWVLDIQIKILDNSPVSPDNLKINIRTSSQSKK
jgi:hypothetical protein